ncbi:MAG: hypothetical protein IJV00_02925 [Clostridia bacterium]|nr:hypothetical protein [Clostridia bacterium]
MIPCTEFIPAYSELFAFIEKKHGRDEVEKFWQYLFEPDGKGIPLINFLEKEGIRGCYSYWSGTLNEEAADFSLYLNEKAGWFMIEMRRCPSKGRLLELKEKIGLVPYPDYCLHCFHYRSAIEKAGLKYAYDFTRTDRAACGVLITDPKIFDGKLIIDENTLVMSKNASDNEYFHRDFHSSMNMGVDYLFTRFGEEEVREYLRTYAENAMRPELERIRYGGLDALEETVKGIYEKEEAPDAVKTRKSEKTLSVRIAYCPAVKHLKETGRRVSPCFSLTTDCVFERLAEEAGMKFENLFYDENTGEAKYLFALK